jgi:hypothetical protein
VHELSDRARPITKPVLTRQPDQRGIHLGRRPERLRRKRPKHLDPRHELHDDRQRPVSVGPAPARRRSAHFLLDRERQQLDALD